MLLVQTFLVLLLPLLPHAGALGASQARSIKGELQSIPEYDVLKSAPGALLHRPADRSAALAKHAAGALRKQLTDELHECDRPLQHYTEEQIGLSKQQAEVQRLAHRPKDRRKAHAALAETTKALAAMAARVEQLLEQMQRTVAVLPSGDAHLGRNVLDLKLRWWGLR